MPGHPVPLCSKVVPHKDLMVDWLARALLDANRVGGSFGHLYADSVSTAIIARLLASANRITKAKRRQVGELARWRLQRAVDYLEAHLDKQVSLADVASSAGLSRMHFAAQFKAATGLRPHEYFCVVGSSARKKGFLEPACRWWDVGLSVGFQTQTHFTTVFTRYVGQPPRAWRESRDAPMTNRCSLG